MIVDIIVQELSHCTWVEHRDAFFGRCRERDLWDRKIRSVVDEQWLWEVWCQVDEVGKWFKVLLGDWDAGQG